MVEQEKAPDYYTWAMESSASIRELRARIERLEKLPGNPSLSEELTNG